MKSTSEATAKYDAENTRRFDLKLNKKTDRDIIDKLDTIAAEGGSKQGYVKECIRKDLHK